MAKINTFKTKWTAEKILCYPEEGKEYIDIWDNVWWISRGQGHPLSLSLYIYIYIYIYTYKHVKKIECGDISL